jgi:Arc/MetJ-type ribon-helix-helix transcriptional regulator
MTIDVKPETRELVQDEIRRGHFRSVDEIIVEGVNARREKYPAEPAAAKSRKPLYDLLTQPPFAGSGLEIERQNDHPRDIDLS